MNAYPPMELKVLHGILVNDHLQWIDKANAALSDIGPYPKALIPLTLADFTHSETGGVMSMVLRAISTNTPIHEYALAYVGTGIYAKVYQRIIDNPDVEPAFDTITRFQELPLPFHTFLKAVYALRRNRLERELIAGLVPQADTLEWATSKMLLGRKRCAS